jgi:phosphoribosylanthranilate isomerase
MPNPTLAPFIVKVCGVTSRDDAQAALDAGANALGFNFYSESPRFLTRECAAEIISDLRGEFLRVGVFVNPSSQLIAEVSPFLDVAQIHGQGEATLPVWRSVHPGVVPPPDSSVQAWLLDTPTPAYGGSGRTFDWSLAAAFPYPAIVAGGLDATNVAEAVRVVNPWGVDSCSRLESSPGRKDHARMTAFVASALHAFHSRQVVTI